MLLVDKLKRLLSASEQALNYNQYSSASDVWSYGIVLFEVWTLALRPYNRMTNNKVAICSYKQLQNIFYK